MQIFYSFLKTIWKNIRSRFNYWVITDSRGLNSFAVIGNASGRNPYCRIYLGQRDFPKVRVVWYKGGTGIAETLRRKHGLVVLSEMPASVALLDQVLHVPNFISLAINLPESSAAYLKSLSSGMRNNIRQIPKRGFTFQVLRDSSWVSTFYHDYYRPAIAQSHGDEAYVYSESAMLERFSEQGVEFIQVYLDGCCVGAVLQQHRDGCYHMLNMGWKNGDIGLKKVGVPAAVFWFSICRAIDLRCTRINFGGTPPYLENGVTRFKVPWGATFCKELTNYGYRDLLLDPSNPHCYGFLTDNSIVAYGVDNSLIVLSSKLPEECKLPDEFLKDIEAWYVLGKKVNFDWDESSHVHLPLPLRQWYQHIPLPGKSGLPSPILLAEMAAEGAR